MAKKSCDPIIRAAVIKALLLGWPKHVELDSILNTARSSISPELRLMAIIGLIQNKKHSEKDQEELFNLGSWFSGVSYDWRNDVGNALMKGWPHSPKTKEICLQQARKFQINDSKLEYDLALRILLEDYPQDKDVFDFLINEIKHQKHPFFMGHMDAWSLIAKNFKDNPALVAAIDEWLPTQEHFEPQISQATLVGRTSTGKKMLLSMLEGQRWIQWPAAALLNGWGMQDEEVLKVLRSIAYSDAGRSSWIGHLFPNIIEDRFACKKRLLELLNDPLCDRVSFVVSGLIDLEGRQSEVEIIDAILERISKSDKEKDEIISYLISAYSTDERVINIAKQELLKRDGNISAVAKAYGYDDEIRSMIIRVLNPLPVSLRGIIAKQLGDGIGDIDYIISLLKNYDFEEDGSVKTIASISYHALLAKSDINQSDAIDYLSKSIICYGHDYEERRQAAFCGVILLNRADLMINAKETFGIGGDRICSISMGSGLSPNIPLKRFILQNWDVLKTTFRDEFYTRINRHDNLLGFWDKFCSFADEYQSPRDEAIMFFEEQKERNSTPEILRFLGRVKPKSSLLLEYCLHTLRNKDRQTYSFGEIIAACELLGGNFANDKNVLEQIIKDNNMRPFADNVIIALCEGWPDSDELEQIYEQACKSNPELPYYVYFQLICRKSQSDVIIEAFKDSLLKTIPGKQNITRPIIRRLKADDELIAMLNKILYNNPTPSEKATIPRLISYSRGISSELQEWIIKEVEQQLTGTAPPEVGVDLFAGEIRPVVHSLIDVIDQTNWLEMVG